MTSAAPQRCSCLPAEKTFPPFCLDLVLPRYGCFCFGLRTCVAVFAWCFSTLSFGSVILSITVAARVGDLEDNPHVRNPDKKRKELWLLAGCLLAYGLISFPLGILMLRGALKERRTWILPWICAAGVTIVAVAFVLIPLKAIMTWPVVLSISIVLGILTFAWLHALSLFYRMRPRRSSEIISNYTVNDTIKVTDIAQMCRSCSAKRCSAPRKYQPSKK